MSIHGIRVPHSPVGDVISVSRRRESLLSRMAPAAVQVDSLYSPRGHIRSHNTRESHKRQGQDAGGNQGDRGALHALGRLHQVDVLTDAGEDNQSHGEAEGDADGIDDGLAEAQHVGHTTIVELLGDDGQRYTEDGAVGRNQRQEHALGGVERRTDFLQDNLHHLHQGSDDEDEGDGLQEGQLQGNQDVLVRQPCHEGGHGQHEDDGGAHT